MSSPIWPATFLSFFGRFLAAANAVMITTKHTDFDAHFEKKDEVRSEEIPQQAILNNW